MLNLDEFFRWVLRREMFGDSAIDLFLRSHRKLAIGNPELPFKEL